MEEFDVKTILKPAIRPTVAAAMIAALLAAGCATSSGGSGLRIFNQHYFSYEPTDFRVMASSGPPIELFGSPPGGATDEEVVAAIQMPARHSSSTPRLVEVPGQGARLVFAFASGGAVNGKALCAGAVHGGSFQDRLEVSAAYCRGERMFSQAQMSVSGPVGPPDPEFTSAMRRLIDTLGPRVDPSRRRNRCKNVRNCR